MKKHFTTSTGYRLINEWLRNKSMILFSYQEKTWNSYASGHSGMVVILGSKRGVMVDMSQSLSSENLLSRIERMKQTIKRPKKNGKKLQSV